MKEEFTMKTFSGNIALVAAVIMLFVITGCADNGEAERFEQERAVYEDRINEIIAAIDNEINELRDEIEEGTEEEREELYERHETLQEVRNDLDDYLHELRRTTADEWDNLRGEIDQAMEDVENTLQELIARL